MKFSNKQLIDILGTFAIVASLVFVGIQLFLDRQIALAMAYQGRADSRMENLRSTSDNEYYMEYLADRLDRGLWIPPWWNDDIANWQDEFEIQSKGLIISAYKGWADLVGVDNVLYQIELGMLPENQTQSILQTMQYAMDQSPVITGVYAQLNVGPYWAKAAQEFTSTQNVMSP